MAVRLGNYNENKKLYSIKNDIAHMAKIDIIKVIVSNMDDLVQLANDVYDTYCYIKDNDADFAKQLWTLLCRNKVNGIDINSYFSWGAKIGSHAYLSRYGVAIYHQSLKSDLMMYFACDEKDLYRGRGLLLDYLNDNDLSNDILDAIISELEILSANFETYANDFFDSVSAYKCKTFE